MEGSGNRLRWIMITVFVVVLFCMNGVHGMFKADYRDALAKSLLFLEAQRSGYLPENQRVNWRGNSGTSDGLNQGINLVGGYYDAGDHVKFGLPMAFTVTMLSWSVIEYGQEIEAAGQLGYTLDAIKWGTDYFIKAHPEPNVLWGQVGDGNNDHSCWQRAEDMTTTRQAYKIDTSNPGSDLAGETAAAMAAASIAMKNSNPSYSNTLLEHSVQLFEFADKYRGKYDWSISAAAKFYQSQSGYEDELLWAASWLYFATGQDSYLQYVAENAEDLGGAEWSMQEFTWDVKYAGVQILMAKVLMQGKGGEYCSALEQYMEKAEFFLCAALQKNNGYNIHLTPGGMLYVREWNNMQHVSTTAFLLTVYANYLKQAKHGLQCPCEHLHPSELFKFARSQAEYILGKNPLGMSYLVGYGTKYPIHVHHRGASIVAYNVNPNFIGCDQGYEEWFHLDQANPNVLVGALVGGPGMFDQYEDKRDNYAESEPTTYNSAPLVGLFAKLNSHKKGRRHPSSSSFLFPTQVKDHSHSQDTDGNGTCSAIQVVNAIRGSWRTNGTRYYHLTTTVFNASKKTITNLLLEIKGLGGPIWGVSRVPGKRHVYKLPASMVVESGQQFSFGYNQPGRQPKVSVLSCN